MTIFIFYSFIPQPMPEKDARPFNTGVVHTRSYRINFGFCTFYFTKNMSWPAPVLKSCLHVPPTSPFFAPFKNGFNAVLWCCLHIAVKRIRWGWQNGDADYMKTRVEWCTFLKTQSFLFVWFSLFTWLNLQYFQAEIYFTLSCYLQNLMTFVPVSCCILRYPQVDTST